MADAMTVDAIATAAGAAHGEKVPATGCQRQGPDDKVPATGSQWLSSLTPVPRVMTTILLEHVGLFRKDCVNLYLNVRFHLSRERTCRRHRHV